MWGTDWIELAQDRERWWALVNAVMNLGVRFYLLRYLFGYSWAKRPAVVQLNN
jgi:hypothetical protein